MELTEEKQKVIDKIINKAIYAKLSEDDYGSLCKLVNVSKMDYDMLFDDASYRGLEKTEVATSFREFTLYSSGEETNLKRTYTYYYGDIEYVHAYIEFRKDIKEEDIDDELCQKLADLIYLIVSRDNMRVMLDFLEMSDYQTGIHNHKYFRKKSEALSLNRNVEYSVIFANIRNFKFFNERGGMKYGDKIIIKLSHFLAGIVEADEAMCRLAADNYLFFIKKENEKKVIDILSEVRLDNLEEIFGEAVRIVFWMGVARLGESEPVSACIEHASTCCGLAKNMYKKQIVYFNEELNRMISERNQVVALFSEALENKEFTPYYQAKVNMKTGELVGMEALCRWNRNGEVIPPGQFIPILDKNGMIHALDMYMLKSTCENIAAWKKMGIKTPVISVNISRKNLFVLNIENQIRDIVVNSGVSISDIEIEITETAIGAEYYRLIEFVTILKDMGFRISIDDFGTGYSSLLLINNIMADVIKIDRNFIKNLSKDEKSDILVESIIKIANRLNIQTIAEGVETKEEGTKLIEFGCYNAQGYYYSKPADFDMTTSILKNPCYKPI